MITISSLPFPFKIWIPIQTPTKYNPLLFSKNASFLLTLLIIITTIASFIIPQSLSIPPPSLSISTKHQNPQIMKVHPLPKKRNNIAIQYYNNYQRDPSLPSGGSHHKKLRRLPHIFNRILELPFRSDADVSVEENPDCFRFVAETDNDMGDVRAHTIEIHPGVTKIVVRPNGYLELSSLDDLELDMWRFRLPDSTRPELASAVLAHGELIVTVPKGEEVEEEGSGNSTGQFRGEGPTTFPYEHSVHASVGGKVKGSPLLSLKSV